jgi:hypothetical protein
LTEIKWPDFSTNEHRYRLTGGIHIICVTRNPDNTFNQTRNSYDNASHIILETNGAEMMTADKSDPKQIAEMRKVVHMIADAFELGRRFQQQVLRRALGIG